MPTIDFILDNLPLIGRRTLEHIWLVGVAVSVAIVTGVSIGVLITRSTKLANRVLYGAAVIMTIPSIALFGLLIPLLSPFGYGIGYVPAVIALILYAQLPIIRNTYTAIMNVDPALREAARGMGMTTLQRLRQVELPIALPVIVNGRPQRGRPQHRRRRHRDLYRRRRPRHLHLARHLADRHPPVDHRRPRRLAARDRCRSTPCSGVATGPDLPWPAEGTR